MLDRRIMVACVGAIVIVAGAASLRSPRSTVVDEAPGAPASINEGSTPSAAVVVSDIDGASSPIDATTGGPPPSAPAIAAPSPVTSSTVAGLDALVAAQRPAINAAVLVADGHDHTTGASNTPDIAAIAGTVIATAWTWRFDDPPDRNTIGLAPIADPQVTTDLVAPAEQFAARVEAGEISWVIVRDVKVAGDVATVRFDHHLVTSTTPEQIVTRTAHVTVLAAQAVRVEVSP